MRVWPVLIVLLGGLGYSNKEQIRGMFIVTNNGAGIVELTPFEHHMQQEIERLEGMIVVLRADSMIKIDDLAEKLAERDSINYQALVRKQDALQAEISKIKQVVQ